MTTTTKTRTLWQALNEANPEDLADLIKELRLGTILAPLKVAFASLSATATLDITSAAAKAAATITGALTLASGENLPPILSVTTLRVTGTGGGNKPGIYVVTDVAGTPYDAGATAVGVATLSDDGTTLVFNAQVTALTLTYIPRPYRAMTTIVPVATLQ